MNPTIRMKLCIIRGKAYGRKQCYLAKKYGEQNLEKEKDT